MKYYAVESKLIVKNCDCKEHPNGVCSTVKTIVEDVVYKLYDGAFFDNQPTTNQDAKERFINRYSNI